MTKQRITRQERIISELKTFQVTALEEIFKKVENLDPLDSTFLAGIFDNEHISKNLKKFETIYAANLNG